MYHNSWSFQIDLEKKAQVLTKTWSTFYKGKFTILSNSYIIIAHVIWLSEPFNVKEERDLNNLSRFLVEADVETDEI